MSVPHPGGDPNANLYYQLKRDVLDRVPEIASVEYVPNRAEATKLEATFDPSRLDVEAGPEPPTLDISWYRGTPDDWFRIDYNGETVHRAVEFEHETPSLVLWEIVDRLLDDVLPTRYD